MVRTHGSKVCEECSRPFLSALEKWTLDGGITLICEACYWADGSHTEVTCEGYGDYPQKDI